MLLYYGTDNKEEILKNGLALKENREGKFGTGIYLTPYKKKALEFGKDVTFVEIDEDNMGFIDYEALAEMFGLNAEEQEGSPELRNFARRQEYDVMYIAYDLCAYDIVVYNPDAVRVVQ